MSTVWVITEGSYSDYKILAVYDTEQAAREYADLHEAEIETWELNTPDGGHHTQEFWEVCIRTGIRGPNDRTAWKYWDISSPRWRERDIGYPLRLGIHDYGNTVYVYADTKERALKIAQDEIARRKAQEAGIA